MNYKYYNLTNKMRTTVLLFRQLNHLISELLRYRTQNSPNLTGFIQNCPKRIKIIFISNYQPAYLSFAKAEVYNRICYLSSYKGDFS